VGDLRAVASADQPDAPPQGAELDGLIKSGIGWKMASQVIVQIARIVLALLLARLLSPNDFGLAGMALIASSYVVVFSDLALGAAVIQRKHLSETDLSTAFWISVSSGVVFAVLGVAVAGPVARFFGEPEVEGLFMVMSLSFAITSLGATHRALLTREMDFRALELRMIAATIVGGIIGVVAAALGAGPWAIIAQYMAWAVISTAFMWFVVPWRPQLVASLASARVLSRFGLNVLGNRLLYVSDEAATNALIGRFLGAGPLGIYTVAMNVVLIPLSRLAIPLAEVLFPAFSRIQDDRRRIREVWLAGLPYVVAVAAPALVGLAVVAPDFVSVVLGDRWSAAVPVVQILALVGIMRCIQGWNSSIVLAVDRADILFKTACVSFSLTLASVGVGVLAGDIVAVAAVYAIVITVFSAAYTTWVVREVGGRGVDVARVVWGPLAAALIMGGLVLGARLGMTELSVDAWLRLLTAVLFAIPTYGVALRWTARSVFDRIGQALFSQLSSLLDSAGAGRMKARISG
jgi:O-antigen/teichoic acid export membrane protein